MNTSPVYPGPSGTGRAPLRPFPGRLILLPVCIYLLFVLPVWVDNNAGSGLAIPQNILAWGAMTLSILIAVVQVLRTCRITTGWVMAAAAAGTALLMLPALWTPCSLWLQHAVPRLSGTAGALTFALALCQAPLTPFRRRCLLQVVVISALVQAAEAMMQAWTPHVGLMLMDFSDTVPYGIFQQRNLLGSWLATGCAVSLYLALTARTRARALGWVCVLYPLSAALMLSQSRTGLLGLVLAVLLTGAADLPRLRPLAVLCRVMFLLSLTVWCIGISLWVMPSGARADFEHAASTQARLRMLDGTLEMIREHPLAGNGAGSFEVRFPQALARTGLPGLEGDTITHPHNEFLYAEAEGGVTALVGMLLLAGVWLWPLVHRLRYRPGFSPCPDTGLWTPQERPGAWLLPLTNLPLVLHMMTEYPLYLSAPHLMVLILLFRLGIPARDLRQARMPALLWAALPAVAASLVLALTLLQAGFRTQSALTRAEEEMNAGYIPDLPPADWRTLTQAERLDHDRHMLMAVSPGFTHRPGQMALFTVWGEHWLSVHNDAEVSAVMLFLALRRGDRASAERLRTEAARIFVHDPRFVPERR